MLSLLPASEPIIIPLKQSCPGQSGRVRVSTGRGGQHGPARGGQGKGAEGAARSTVIPESLQRLTHPAGLKIKKWAHPVHDLCARGGRTFLTRAGDSKWQRHL